MILKRVSICEIISPLKRHNFSALLPGCGPSTSHVDYGASPGQATTRGTEPHEGHGAPTPRRHGVPQREQRWARGVPAPTPDQ